MRSARTRTNQRRARGPTTDFCQVLDESRTMARARGVEGPSLSLDRAKRNPTRPPAALDLPRIRRSERMRTNQRARPARLNDYTAKVWTSLAERRAGRGKRRSRVRKGEAEPKTPRRAGWGKRLIWTNLGRFSHGSPIPRGAESDFFSLCRWLRRGETPNGNEPTTFHSRHRPPGAYARGLRPVVISFSSLGALAGRALQLLNNHKTPAKLL